MGSPQLGDIVAQRYRLDEVLGQGGFGIVFRAADLQLGRAVALKVLLADPGGRDASARARFAREASLVARLSNPHVATLFDHGETEDGSPFLVFELIEGCDLTELLAARQRLSAPEVEHVVRQVLQALREAHDAGVLHRDIKPSNIRVSRHPDDPLRVRLIDFGIARSQADGSPSITKTGELLGTPRYMSPEQLTERPLTAASDLYSLGLVGLELLGAELTGNRLPDQFDRMRTGHMFALPNLDPHGARLAAVFGRLTAPRPEDRPQSAAAVLAMLGASPSPRALVDAPPPQPTARPRPSTATSGVIGVVVIGVVVIGLAVLWLGREGSRSDEKPRATISPPAAPTALLRGGNPDPTPDPMPAPAGADLGHPDLAPDTAATTANTSPGCGTAPEYVGAVKKNREAGHYLYVPGGYQQDTPAPLVVLIPQVEEDPGDLFHASKFMNYADRAGWLVATVDHGDVALLGAFELELARQMIGARVKAAVRVVMGRVCVDTTRIYVVGQGFGGEVARQLACEPWVAAVAANSTRSGRGEKICEVPKPTMLLHPLKSPREPVEGGYGACERTSTVNFRSIAEENEAFKDRNHCTGEPQEYSTHRGGRCETWDCVEPFVSCEVDGGHNWPGSPRPDLENCDGIAPNYPTGESIWKFFESLSPPDGL